MSDATNVVKREGNQRNDQKNHIAKPRRVVRDLLTDRPESNSLALTRRHDSNSDRRSLSVGVCQGRLNHLTLSIRRECRRVVVEDAAEHVERRRR